MTQALDTLLELAVRQRDTGLLALQEADTAGARAAQQADQLDDYRNQQQARSPLQAGRTAPIDAVRSHGGFMQRLQDAVSQQRRTLQAAQSRAAALRTELLMLEQRVASVRKLQHRRLLETEHAMARQDQRRSDEMAQQRAWRARSEAAAATGFANTRS